MKATLGLAVHIGRASTAFWALDCTRNPWLARITGLDLKYEIARDFLRPKTDYSQADKKGRGTKKWYILDPGVYEVLQPLKRFQERRYFIRVAEDGSVLEIDKEAAMADLKHHFESLEADFVWRHFGARAGLDGVNVYPTTKSHVEWFGLRAGSELAAIYGLMKVSKTKHRLKGMYVLPGYRPAAGKLCVEDAMHKVREANAQLSLESLVYDWELAYFEGLDWQQVESVQPKPAKHGVVTKIAWTPELKEGK